MKKKLQREMISCEYFQWTIYTRNGVWQADGRSNAVDAGRNSLGTRDYEEARKELIQLDRQMAVDLGLAEKNILEAIDEPTISISDGISEYLADCQNPSIVGGVRPSTVKRYVAILDKFETFSRQTKLKYWSQVTNQVVKRYVAWLPKQRKSGYAERTLTIEANTVKQVNRWLIENEMLPHRYRINLKVKKINDSPTYCWKPEEVHAMLELTKGTPELNWLWRVLLTLTYTGARSGEICQLEWRDIDLNVFELTIRHESGSEVNGKSKSRTTKTGKTRIVPIKRVLADMFSQMPATNGRVFSHPEDDVLEPDKIRKSLIKDVLTPLSQKFPPSGTGKSFINGRVHSFRHFFCSQCANGGVPEPVVKKWMGHSKDSQMFERYYHLNDRDSRTHMFRLNLLDLDDRLNGESDPDSN
ncbi:MAG: hypothetical protein CMJ46_03955 [Planctomyces sp.]|nr:hypothetical protein [Planctomyces sp.]